MKMLITILAILMSFTSEGQIKSTGKPLEVVEAEGISIPVYDFKGIQPFLELDDSRVHVINFWATWCKPCVEELPGFIKLTEELKNENIDFLFISLDFRKNLESKLIPFVREHQMQGKVVMLNDPDANAWIDKVDPNWSGAIPATLIYKKGQKEFFEQMLTYDELKSTITTHLKQ